MYFIRFILVCLTAMIASCAPTLPEGATPVDLLSARGELMAETPGTVAFEVVSSRSDFLIGENGNAVYFAKTSSSGLATETQISSFTADEICLAPNGGWSGICISIFESPSGGLVCVGQFGNGRRWTSDCTVQALTRSDRR